MPALGFVVRPEHPPERCAATIGELAEAGADSVVLVPPPGLDVDVATLGRELRR